IINNQSFIADNYHLEILDLSGRSLINLPIQSLICERVDVSSLESGIYVLRINNQEFLYNTLFVKN
ncbi:MAG: T9SS type A sorting domain-containing protein, partial [Bacteroidales bacterium]|nr:T9SS type A sorting domain-containing protein [Bacteroidales bacterium]